MTQVPLELSQTDPPADGPRWVAQDDYRMLSMALTIKSMDAAFADAVRWHLAPFRATAPVRGGLPVELVLDDDDAEGRRWVFRIGTYERFRSQVLTEAVHQAVWMLHAEVPQRVRDSLLLHAGAVARDEQALLLPARSGSGKSSLTLGLLEAGFSYLSDELGAIDPVTERAYPFPKHIKLAPDALEVFPALADHLRDRREVPFRLWERFIRPHDIGAQTAGPTEVRWLVFPSSDFDGPPRLQPMSKAESVEVMAANCFNLFRYGERGVVLLSRVARAAQAFRLVGGSVGARVALLSDRLR